MVLDKHNKHSIKHKKEMRKHNIVGQVLVRVPLCMVKPLHSLTRMFFFLCPRLSEHSSEGFPFPMILFLLIWEMARCK